jgi:phosphoribosylamine--glycine ligase
MKKILLIGSGAREHAIARAIKKSQHTSSIICFANSSNTAIQSLCTTFHIGDLQDTQSIVDFAVINNNTQKIAFALIGSEAPLANGIVDRLKKLAIPTIGPTRKLAQIETSKGFARDLLKDYAANFLPRYQRFNAIKGVKEFLNLLQQDYVVKADGLMNGKGVKVSPEHLGDHKAALDYCKELLAKNCNFVIEEKFIGQEFSLLSFCDGKNLAHMPIVQDHKRAFDGDIGANTGGMGSYTDVNHRLPFLSEQDVAQAQLLNQITIDALTQKCGDSYKGILYGGFMLTKDGVKLIEYNARFGDPEAINLLALLQSDFVDICVAIIDGTLNPNAVSFARQATVCKYLVPNGYPDNPQKNALFDIDSHINQEALYYATINAIDNKLYTTSSRALAVLGVGDNICAAEKMAEEIMQKITGPLFHRSDIGNKLLINKKIHQINLLCNKNYPFLG